MPRRVRSPLDADLRSQHMRMGFYFSPAVALLKKAGVWHDR